MARSKPVETEAHIPEMPQHKEVLYTILVPDCNDQVQVESAKRALSQHQISEALIFVHPASTDDEGKFWPGHVSVPRLFTLWQGDEKEAEWQKAIKAALPGTLIDVADWTPAPGYPIGDENE